MSLPKHNAAWSPLYFLSALGAGGMIVTFFMYLLFWVEHPGQPIPLYEDWTAAFSQGSVGARIMIGVAVGGVGVFMLYHVGLLVWNLLQYQHWRAAGKLAEVQGTNAHTQMLAIPLTLAMTINAGFIVGALFIPNLWSKVEILLPVAIAGFAVLGIWAMRLYLSFFSRTVSEKRFDTAANNSLAQLMPGFAFAMIGVGLAAPAAMSHNQVTVASSLFLSGLFIVPALFVTGVKLVIGIGHILEHGASRATLPTLWVGVPILTTLSIAALRLDHGLTHTLGINEQGTTPLLFLGLVVATQIFLLLLGTAVMNRMDYFRAVWNGEERSPVAYALICPGVALSVSLHFLINKGLVAAGLIAKFGIAYWAFSAVAIAIQLLTALALFKLVRRLIMAKQAEPVLLPV